jgi:hypothetical protein
VDRKVVDSGSGCGMTTCVKGCKAVPSRDSTCGESKPPHYYACVVPYDMPIGCVQVLVGNATDGYCCP